MALPACVHNGSPSMYAKQKAAGRPVKMSESLLSRLSEPSILSTSVSRLAAVQVLKWEGIGSSMACKCSIVFMYSIMHEIFETGYCCL